MNTDHSRQRLLRLRLLTRLIISFNIALATVSVGLWISGAMEGVFWRADYTAFYTGWSLVLSGDGSRLYDITLQDQRQLAILDGRSFEKGLLAYINPPHLTLPFSPLALLPLEHSFWLWSLIQLIILGYVLYLFSNLTKNWNASERRIFITGILAFSPLLFTLLKGTFSLLMLLFLTAMYRSVKQGKSSGAGLWLALGTLKPQLVVMPSVVLIATKRFRVIVACVALVVLLAIPATFVLGVQTWGDFLAALNWTTNLFYEDGRFFHDMYNLKGTLTLILGSDYGSIINHISSIAFILAAIVTAILSSNIRSTNLHMFELQMALAILTGMIFSPHLFVHDSLLLVLVIFLYYSYLREYASKQRYGLLFNFITVFILFDGFGVVRMPLIRIPTLIMIVLIIYLILDIRRLRCNSEPVQKVSY